jgi:hypothetical protein
MACSLTPEALGQLDNTDYHQHQGDQFHDCPTNGRW